MQSKKKRSAGSAEISSKEFYLFGIMHLPKKIIFLCTNSVDNFVNKNLYMRLTPLQTRVLLFCSKFRLHKTVNIHQVADNARRLCGARDYAQSRLYHVHKLGS